MSASHGGKGDTPRPVDPKKYGENYERIFRKPEDPRHRIMREARHIMNVSGQIKKMVNDIQP